MMKSIRKHVSRCVSGIWCATTQFIKRETSASELCNDCKKHVVTAWQECTRPPATEQHRLAVLHLKRGMASYKESLFADAANEFEKAIDADPKYGRAYLYYGNAQYKLHDYEEACKCWEFVLSIDPHSDVAEKARRKLERFTQTTQRPVAAH